MFIYLSNRTSYAQQVPYLTTGRSLGGPPPPPSRWHAGSPPAGGCQPSDWAAPAAVIGSPPDSAAAAAAAGSSPGKQPLRVAPLGARYAAQAASLARRVTAGKSAIHGFGAFTKLPHAAGDCHGMRRLPSTCTPWNVSPDYCCKQVDCMNADETACRALAALAGELARLLFPHMPGACNTPPLTCPQPYENVLRSEV